MTMKIGNIDIAERTLIIAEIGNNHEGDYQIARMLVQKAAESGADAVKFQTIRAARFVTREEESRFHQIQGYELSDEQFAGLAELAGNLGILFLSTPFDFKSADILDELVPAFKIASGDLTWYQFLEHVARKGKPILLSTGMSDEKEIERAIQVITSTSSLPKGEQLVLLHCVASYPTHPQDANLLTIQYLREKYDVPVGYSDHTLGIQACQTAIALGSHVIEKHFTYRKEDQSFRDHALSADPDDMKELVISIRNIETMLGKGGIIKTDNERQNRAVMRRSLAAARNIHAGEPLTGEDITFLRPGSGIPPDDVSTVLGRCVIRDILKGCIIRREDLE